MAPTASARLAIDSSHLQPRQSTMCHSAISSLRTTIEWRNGGMFGLSSAESLSIQAKTVYPLVQDAHERTRRINTGDVDGQNTVNTHGATLDKRFKHAPYSTAKLTTKHSQVCRWSVCDTPPPETKSKFELDSNLRAHPTVHQMMSCSKWHKACIHYTSFTEG